MYNMLILIYLKVLEFISCKLFNAWTQPAQKV